MKHNETYIKAKIQCEICVSHYFMNHVYNKHFIVYLRIIYNEMPVKYVFHRALEQ